MSMPQAQITAPAAGHPAPDRCGARRLRVLPIWPARASLLPGVALEIMPLPCGPCDAVATTLRLGEIVLQIGRSDPCIGFAVVAPGVAALQVPLAGEESLIVNGHHWGERMLCAYGPGAEMIRANPAAGAHAAVLLPAERCTALLDGPPRLGLFRPGARDVLQAGVRPWQVLSALLRDIALRMAQRPAALEGEPARQALAEDLLAALRALLADAQTTLCPPARSTERRLRLVAATDAYLRADLSRPVYTEELCQDLGTSASALAEAFRATLGISPHRFVKLRRLGLVHAALSAPDGPAPMVKAVALGHGFWHLGQFAADYRAQFNETPSETLLRARSTRAAA